MSQFTKVTVDTAANVYFDGNVTSRTVHFEDGTMKTLGFMLPGEYRFNTGDAEIMQIQSGKLDVQLPDSDDWQAVKGGEQFEVPANSAFTVRIKTPTDYICSFIKG